MEIPRPGGKKILLVDDNLDLLNVYAAKFKEQGFAVTTAADGQEAWDLLQGGYMPNVLITGILMPRMTGFELIEKIQADQRFASLPTAISSHRGRQEDKIQAKKMGVDDFITQGLVPLNEVVRRINLLLGVGEKYTIKLTRNDRDTEALINLLDKQQLSSIGIESPNVLLELTPGQEKGSFQVKIIPEQLS